MNEIMLEITQAVIIICAVILMKYLIPWIKSKIEATQYEWVVNVVTDAVQYAEQVAKGKEGSDKLEMVTRYVKATLNERNISIPDSEIRAAIESTVYLLKKEAVNGD